MLKAAFSGNMTVQCYIHSEGPFSYSVTEHGDVQQKKRLRELTLINFDRVCRKNETTFM